MSLTLGEALQLGRSQLSRMDPGNPREADYLLSHAAGCPRSRLYSHPEQKLEAGQVSRYRAMLQDRLDRVPLAYLVGQREFWSLQFKVSPSILIPRAETETLVAQALQRLSPGLPGLVLDLGTGSGVVAVSLATERPELQLTAVDCSAEALSVAAENCRRLGCPQLRLLVSDWYTGLEQERFDMIVSNPPYVAEGDPHLQLGDLPGEPRSALVSGVEGLDAITKICDGAPEHLRPGGWLLLEHAPWQGKAVQRLLSKAGLVDGCTMDDHSGQPRVSGARLPAAGP